MLLRARLRAGELTQQHVELAASLEHAAARELSPDAEPFAAWGQAPRFDPSNRSTAVDPEAMKSAVAAIRRAISAAVRLQGDTLPARLAADWGEHVLSVVQGQQSKDVGPSADAIAAARAWANCPCEEHRRAAGETARAVAEGIASDETLAVARVARWAASAASQQASEMWCDRGEVGSSIEYSSAVEMAIGDVLWCSFAAAFALGAKGDRVAELEWQRLRLAAYVLGEVDSDEPEVGAGR
jgi:hypothetical protein